jgi:imidazolonepropionase-like amidohydrolase
MEKSLGAVAPGFYADIVAVEGDPLANIKEFMKTCMHVISGGKAGAGG